MRYMCLVHVDATLMGALSESEGKALTRECIDYDNELSRSGHYILSSALKDPDTAAIVRVRQGKVSMTDGPYVETKEHLGGFLFVEARDLNEAIDIAAKCPMAHR